MAGVDPAQIAIIRRLTPTQRAQQALSMIRTAERSAAYRLRARQLDTGEGKSLWLIRRQEYDKEQAAFVDQNIEFNNFIRSVVDALEEADITYLIGGSVAAWAWGESRITRDLDLVIDLPLDRVHALSDELEKRGMFTSPDVIMDLLRSPGDPPINAIHMPSGFKAKFFLVRADAALRHSAFRRRLLVDFGDPLGKVFVHSPEDLILYKLIYHSLGQQSKHIRDITSILSTIDDELEADYMRPWLDTLDLVDVWQEIQSHIHREDSSDLQ